MNFEYAASDALQPLGLGPSLQDIDVICCLVHSMAAMSGNLKRGHSKPGMQLTPKADRFAVHDDALYFVACGPGGAALWRTSRIAGRFMVQE